MPSSSSNPCIHQSCSMDLCHALVHAVFPASSLAELLARAWRLCLEEEEEDGRRPSNCSRPNRLAHSGLHTDHGPAGSPETRQPREIARSKPSHGAQPRDNAGGHKQPPRHGKADPLRPGILRPARENHGPAPDVRTGHRVRPLGGVLAPPPAHSGHQHVLPPEGGGLGGTPATSGR